jgi:diguanylate cyclase (GGDEF)-like protein
VTAVPAALADVIADVVAEAAPVGFLVVSEGTGDVVWANGELRRLLGPAGGALPNAPSLTSKIAERNGDGPHQGDEPAATTPAPGGLPLDACVPGGDAVDAAWAGPEDEQRWLRMQCRVLTGECDGLHLYTISDVTVAHRRATEAAARERRLSRAESLARIGTWEWHVPTNEVYWSDALLEMFGFRAGDELDYGKYRSLLYPDDVALIESTLAEALRTGAPFEYTHRMYLADRVSLRVFECYGEVLLDPGGQPERVLGTAHDITEKERTKQELAYLAEHDPLTGLRNRRSITNYLKDRLADPSGRAGALLLIDVDNFKDVNDLRGHAIGDTVMRSLAQKLRDWVGSQSVLGRLGGDEFAVILPEGDADDALAVAESLCDAFSRHPIPAEDTMLRLTASIGIAPLEAARDCEVVLANADLALYEAKGAGRNRAKLFMPEQYQHAAKRVSVLQRVRTALDTGQMGLDAQPIVCLQTGKVMGHELLIRLRDGKLPDLGPAEFLPATERTDLVLALDRWVLERAIAALAAGGDGFALEVNLSSRSLEDAELGTHIVSSLEAAGVPPERLGLEITETAAISSLDAARRLAEQITAAGCRFTLDDFGSGFGSFTYLKHLPFSGVKIAGEFVRHADRTAADRVLIEAIVRVARGLGMRTIAEYVDRPPLVTALHELGVDLGQGFHLGRPQPLDELLA